jgi:hypothetical protein
MRTKKPLPQQWLLQFLARRLLAGRFHDQLQPEVPQVQTTPWLMGQTAQQ